MLLKKILSIPDGVIDAYSLLKRKASRKNKDAKL
jgi:hypothetical protein